MFNLIKFANRVIHHMTRYDMGVAKIDLVVVGLLLAKLFPVLLSLERGWYVGFIILCEIYFMARISNMPKR